MRTHGFRTHVLLVVAGAVGLLASLSRPWYARAPSPRTDDPLFGLFHGLQRWVSDSQGVTGSSALGSWATALALLACVSALAGLCATVPSLQGLARDPLRYAALAAAAIVAWRLVDPPHANAAWELRHGALIAAASVLVMVCGALPVANAPRRRRAALA
jgi:hypothetical protein